MLWQPHEYQRQARDFMLARDHAGLFLDPGLGKTSISLAALKRLKLRGVMQRALVVVPLRPLYLVWPLELQKWDSFKSLTFSILHGRKKEEAFDQHADIDLINPEGLIWLFGKLKRVAWPYEVLIVDESTKFKWTHTRRFKSLKPYLARFSRRYILTGSPAPRSLMDLFGQMHVMDDGQTFGRRVGEFREEYFRRTGYMNKEWKLKAGSDQRIYAAIAPKALRMSATDHLDMPQLIVNDVWVDLPPEARTHYRTMENDLFAQFADGHVTAANAAVASNKCRQIASGGVYTDDDVEHIHYAKAEAVADLIEELSGQPVIVAFTYKHDLTRLLKTLGDVPYVTGGMSMRKMTMIEAQWNRGELPVLLGETSVLAYGLNLQYSGNTLIIHTPTSKLDDYDQLIRRLWRQGQKASSVIVHRILARHTVDVATTNMLIRKDRSQVGFFNALREYYEAQSR